MHPRAVRTCVSHSLNSELLLSLAENFHSGLEEPSSEDSRPMEATLVDHTPAPPQAETAGSLGQMNYDSLEHILASHRSQLQDDAPDETSEQNGEQALESHEVIELQAFSERKVWVGEKIKVLVPVPISPVPACP